MKQNHLNRQFVLQHFNQTSINHQYCYHTTSSYTMGASNSPYPFIINQDHSNIHGVSTNDVFVLQYQIHGYSIYSQCDQSKYHNYKESVEVVNYVIMFHLGNFAQFRMYQVLLSGGTHKHTMKGQILIKLAHPNFELEH